MATLTIRTNYHWREVTYGFQLTPKQREEFDYLDEGDIEGHSFAVYNGCVYDLSEFMRIPECPVQEHDPDYSPMREWQGGRSDSYFSGVVNRFDKDLDRFQIGTYYS